jgi:hypothetical protein
MLQVVFPISLAARPNKKDGHNNDQQFILATAITITGLVSYSTIDYR